jgi:hypothetical protein
VVVKNVREVEIFLPRTSMNQGREEPGASYLGFSQSGLLKPY